MDVLMFIIKGLMVVALVFLGLCAVAVLLLIVGAVTFAVRSCRKRQKWGG